MNKILSILLMLCFFVNISFAFDSYADDEVEKKSYKKLYYGIVLTLLGGFLAYDGFSTEEVDISKPSVDYTTVLHSEWVQKGQNGSEVQNEIGGKYILRSGYTDNSTIPPEAGTKWDYTKYKIDGEVYTVEQNILYNNGNVDLRNLTIEVRYKYDSGTIIKDENPGEHENFNGEPTSDGYHKATKTEVYENLTLKKGKSLTWQDVWEYSTAETSPPNRNEREPYTENDEGEIINPGTAGLNLGKDGLSLMNIRIKLNKNQQYKPIYEKRHKSEIEGVAGIMVGLAGIYFIVDHFIDMHKFNNYAKKHDLNFKILTASNGYKLMLQKRI